MRTFELITGCGPIRVVADEFCYVENGVLKFYVDGHLVAEAAPGQWVFVSEKAEAEIKELECEETQNFSKG